jgi:hypothetical protein
VVFPSRESLSIFKSNSSANGLGTDTCAVGRPFEFTEFAGFIIQVIAETSGITELSGRRGGMRRDPILLKFAFWVAL